MVKDKDKWSETKISMQHNFASIERSCLQVLSSCAVTEKLQSWNLLFLWIVFTRYNNHKTCTKVWIPITDIIWVLNCLSIINFWWPNSTNIFVITFSTKNWYFIIFFFFTFPFHPGPADWWKPFPGLWWGQQWKSQLFGVPSGFDINYPQLFAVPPIFRSIFSTSRPPGF